MSERIAQIDMDGTLVDFDKAIDEELAKLSAPGEVRDDSAPWMKARRRLVKSQPGFWENLPRLEAGFAVLDLIKEIGFEVKVLTKGPEKLLDAWTEKVRWCRKHLGVGVPVTVCEGKGDTYGRVLFDDWPPYVTDWMKWSPRGLVIMMGHPWNLGFTHPNVIRIDRDHLTRDLKALRPRLQAAYDR